MKRKASASLFGLLVCATAHAQLDLSWYTIDSGGGTSTGGVYTLSGTVGQPDAVTSTGGGYTLAGGFWSATTPSTPCPGDVDGDGDVDITDLDFVLSNFGMVGPGIAGDVDGDNDVDLTDLAIVLANFDATCG